MDLTAVHCAKATEALQAYFKFNDFRRGQLDALLPVLHSGGYLCMYCYKYREIIMHVLGSFGS